MKVNDIDPECVDLCRVLNNLPGIATFESCCGHGKTSYRIWFTAQSIDNLTPIILTIQKGYRCRIEVDYHNVSGQFHFLLEAESIKEADRLKATLSKREK